MHKTSSGLSSFAVSGIILKLHEERKMKKKQMQVSKLFDIKNNFQKFPRLSKYNGDTKVHIHTKIQKDPYYYFCYCLIGEC